MAGQGVCVAGDVGVETDCGGLRMMDSLRWALFEVVAGVLIVGWWVAAGALVWWVGSLVLG